jgi:mevalonate kinase
LLIFDTPHIQEKSFQKKVSEIGHNQLPKCLQFLEAALIQFQKQFPHIQLSGLNITTRSQFSDQYGFGSSSAVSVAFAFALVNLFDLDLDNRQLFDLVYPAIIDVQKVGSGFDIAAAIWGGTIYYVSPAEVVEQLSLQELPLMVGYTGIKASTSQIIQQVAQFKKQHHEKVERIFAEITEIVKAAKTALQKNDLQKVGQLMQQNQALLNELNVSSPKLDQLISAAQTAGATGAKLSGAGGGDCMIAVGAEQKKSAIEDAITKAGGQVLKVKTNAEGVRYEKSAT